MSRWRRAVFPCDLGWCAFGIGDSGLGIRSPSDITPKRHQSRSNTSPRHPRESGDPWTSVPCAARSDALTYMIYQSSFPRTREPSVLRDLRERPWVPAFAGTTRRGHSPRHPRESGDPWTSAPCTTRSDALTCTIPPAVVPANAGTQRLARPMRTSMGSRLRGNDAGRPSLRLIQVLLVILIQPVAHQPRHRDRRAHHRRLQAAAAVEPHMGLEDLRGRQIVGRLRRRP